jgi:hypothetical protein
MASAGKKADTGESSPAASSTGDLRRGGGSSGLIFAAGLVPAESGSVFASG